MLTDGPAHLLIVTGDHRIYGQGGLPNLPQDPSSHFGKLLRIEIRTGKTDVLTLGHRNPQGLVRDAEGNLWATEHGPLGGDELNLLETGGNYGWPHVSYGVSYGGTALVGREDAQAAGSHAGYVRPVFAWIPSIAASAIVVNDRRRFPLWKDDFLVGALHGRTNGRGIFRVRLGEGRVQYVERIRLDRQVRDMAHMSDGRLAVLLNDEYVLFMSPSREYCDEESRANRSIYAIHCDSDTGGDSGAAPKVGGPDGARPPAGDDPPPASGTSAQLYARHCGSCHSLDVGEHDVGPSLAGVAGRRAGKVEGYYDFSTALRSLDFVWTRGALERYLADPGRFAPGTSMPATNISDTDIRLIIDFISSFDNS